MSKQKSIYKWASDLFDNTWPMGNCEVWERFIDSVISEHERRKRAKKNSRGKK